MTPKNNIYPLLSILEKINIDVVDVSIAPIGDYYEYKDNSMDSKNCAIINIGYYKTDISLFNKGILTNKTTIDLGGRNIDNDISYVYKLNKEMSSNLKVSYGIINSQSSNLLDINYNNTQVNLKELSKIIESRLEEILDMCKKELKYLTKKKIDYIIVTGGTSEVKNINQVLDKVFDKDASIGNILEIGARNNKYSCALGIIKWYNSKERLRNKDYSIFSIDEQSKLSGTDKEVFNKDSSIISKVFDYFFE